MELIRIQEELDQTLLLFANKADFEKLKDRVGKNQSVLGIGFGLLYQLSEIIVKELEPLSIEKQYHLLKKLIQSHLFEKKWLGYHILLSSKMLLVSLNGNQIFELKPDREGMLLHLYSYHILPDYFLKRENEKHLLMRLLHSNSKTDQLILIKTLLVLLNSSNHFIDISTTVIKHPNWYNNHDLLSTLKRLEKKVQSFHSYHNKLSTV